MGNTVSPVLCTPCCCREDTLGVTVDVSPALLESDLCACEKLTAADPRGSLSMGFELPDGSYKTVLFTERPLGLKFTRTEPVAVMEVAPNNHAHALGVEPGWKLKSVGSVQLVNRSTGFAFETLYHQSRKLHAVRSSTPDSES